VGHHSSWSSDLDYTGLLRRTVEVEGLLENTYIFDIDCLQTIKGLDGREVPIEISLHIRFNGWYGAWAFAHAHPEYLPFSH
jgi:hypothetical protein